MVEVINLRGVRKAKQRAEDRAKAAENAVRFGRSTTEKAAETARADKLRRDLDGHQREDSGDGT